MVTIEELYAKTPLAHFVPSNVNRVPSSIRTVPSNVTSPATGLSDRTFMDRHDSSHARVYENPNEFVVNHTELLRRLGVLSDVGII